MLTEQDFIQILKQDLLPNSEAKHGNKTICAVYEEQVAKHIHNQHLAECERLMELAFNAAKEKRYESDFPYGLEKFKTFKDYKDSLSDAPNR